MAGLPGAGVGEEVVIRFRNSVSIAEHPIVDLGPWLQSDPGRYVQSWEQARFDAMVADMFGYNALQAGMPQLDLLRANRMPFKAYAGPVLPDPSLAHDWGGTVLARPEALPFDSQSIDLLVLPHGLEMTAYPHQVLREVDRVLVPEGRVVSSGFNPWSLWGARNRMPFLSPWLPQPAGAQVSLHRLKDWFKLLSFEVDRGHFGCYVPPFRTDKWIRRSAFMESAGDRWWPVCGAVYVVSAVKRVAGMRLIAPAWKRKPHRAGLRQATGVAVNRGISHDEGSTRKFMTEHKKYD